MNKTKIITTLVTLIFSLFVIFAIYNNIKHNKYIDNKDTQSFRIIQQIVDGKIIFFRKLISKRVKNGVYNNQYIKNAITSKDPKQYKKVLKHMFKLLKKENKYIKTFHYISPDNISLFRAHRPTKFGDDLSQKRKIVAATNEKRRALYGFESGLYQIVYRLNIPIVYDDKYYGILEIGLDPFIFVDDLTIIDKYLDSAILIDNKHIEVFKDHDKFKDVLVENETHTLIGQSKVFKHLFKTNKIGNEELLEYNNNHYKQFEYDLMNFDGEVTGKLLFALYNTDDQKWKNDNLQISILLLMFLVIFTFIVVYYAFDYYDKKIKKLTEAEKEHERILHQQSKMASMGEMIGNIAHQWRQPLSIISTAASGIKVQNEFGMLDDKKINTATDNIVEQTEYMSKTIDDFRDFFKSDKEKIQFSFNKLVEKDLVLVESSLRSNYIEVIKDLDIDVMISGFQNELTQAVLNILHNAKDQLVKLPKENDRVIKVETKVFTDHIVLTIIDNAGGIDDRIIHKIFDPYFTTKHQAQGTGIGLYMTHEIIHKHFNGTITAKNITLKHKNKEYTGAKFTIGIPI